MVNFFQKYKFPILLLVILIAASFFRLWQLDSIPPGLYPDVAINGNNALESLKTGNFKVFYSENNGREGLWMWLLALSFSIFGVSIWSMKIVAAIIGILTVLGLYLLTKELFKPICNLQSTIYNNIALLSSFFLAISFWHTNFSRIGFRAILLPFILVFGFYFLFKGFRTQKIWNFIISGIFFGLGFYTYISYRFIAILLPLVLLFWFLIYRKQNLQKKYLSFIICHLLFVILIALPIGIYFFQHFQDFTGRTNSVLIFNTENPLKEFAKSLMLHLGMFNFYGDGNWRHNYVGSPMLFWPIGILFLIGLFLTIKNSLKFRQNLQFAICHLQLLSWFFIMLAPGILTFEGAPHALRTIGVIPVIYIFSGMAGYSAYNWLKENAKNKFLFFLAVFLFLTMTGVSEFNRYFVKWGKNLEVKNAFSENYVKIGNYLNSLPPETQKYVIVNVSGVPVPYPNGIPMPSQTVMFIENTKYDNINEKPRTIYLVPENLEKIKIEKETVIALMEYDRDLFIKLIQKFPQGEIEEKDGVWVYKI